MRADLQWFWETSLPTLPMALETRLHPRIRVRPHLCAKSGILLVPLSQGGEEEGGSALRDTAHREAFIYEVW